mmetsp:Transcript_19981/g.65076  ORF Transcript_19981/g.65076 Transcript_19981/m.65076 type:complete len:261 (+) Transcript_19981:83-865(+)
MAEVESWALTETRGEASPSPSPLPWSVNAADVVSQYKDWSALCEETKAHRQATGRHVMVEMAEKALEQVALAEDRLKKECTRHEGTITELYVAALGANTLSSDLHMVGTSLMKITPLASLKQKERLKPLEGASATARMMVAAVAVYVGMADTLRERIERAARACDKARKVAPAFEPAPSDAGHLPAFEMMRELLGKLVTVASELVRQGLRDSAPWAPLMAEELLSLVDKPHLLDANNAGSYTGAIRKLEEAKGDDDDEDV